MAARPSSSCYSQQQLFLSLRQQSEKLARFSGLTFLRPFERGLFFLSVTVSLQMLATPSNGTFMQR